MRIVVDKNLTVPMRDGVSLTADVYRPDGPGPFPTLVQRTPYNKEFGLAKNENPTQGSFLIEELTAWLSEGQASAPAAHSAGLASRRTVQQPRRTSKYSSTAGPQ